MIKQRFLLAGTPVSMIRHNEIRKNSILIFVLLSNRRLNEESEQSEAMFANNLFQKVVEYIESMGSKFRQDPSFRRVAG